MRCTQQKMKVKVFISLSFEKIPNVNNNKTQTNQLKHFISVREPFAALLVHKIKKVENRTQKLHQCIKDTMMKQKCHS